MDQLLGMFGKSQEQPGDPVLKDSQPQQSSDVIWEFEMPVSGASPPQQAQPSFSIPGGIPQEAVDIQESTLEGYFANIGWTFEKADQGLWVLKYAGGAKDYDIFVELTPQNLVLVVPILDRVREGCREKVWYHILRLNYQMVQLRFGLNKRNEILLTLELPTRTISYEEFKKGIQNLCTTIDESFPEILFLSQKLDAVSTLAQEPSTTPAG